MSSPSNFWSRLIQNIPRMKELINYKPKKSSQQNTNKSAPSKSDGSLSHRGEGGDNE